MDGEVDRVVEFDGAGGEVHGWPGVPDLGGKIFVVFVVAKLMAAPACALLIVIASLSPLG